MGTILASIVNSLYATSASSGKDLKYAAEDFCCQAAWKSRRNAWLPFKALPRRLAAKRPASYFRSLPDEALGFFEKNPRIAIALSGGVDSSYLLYMAKTAGCDVRAYFIKSQFQPEFELRDAASLADSLGVPLTVGALDVLSDPNIAQNCPNRCYHCKTAILSKLWELARADGVAVLCDGTNADDDESDRPGMRALRELGVSSPLRECRLTKSEIRRLSKQAGLLTHDKPAYACLATRIPAGTGITQELLDKIERAENGLFEMGFSDFRVRIIKQGDGLGTSRHVALIQVLEGQWSMAAARRTEILANLQSDFNSVVLDLASR